MTPLAHMQELALDNLGAFASRSTGLAVSGPSTLVVTTEHHAFRLPVEPAWRPDVHWPASFRRAAATTLLLAKYGARHAVRDVAQRPCIWNLPDDVSLRIVRLAAGERADWLSLEDAAAAMPSPSTRIAEGLPEFEELGNSVVHIGMCRCELLLPSCPGCRLAPMA